MRPAMYDYDLTLTIWENVPQINVTKTGDKCIVLVEHGSDLSLVSMWSHLIPDKYYDRLVNPCLLIAKELVKKADICMNIVRVNTRHSMITS